MSEDLSLKRHPIVAFRIPREELERLLKRAKPDESKSSLLRRAIKSFLSKTK